jgi:hypothetical protein
VPLLNGILDRSLGRAGLRTQYLIGEPVALPRHSQAATNQSRPLQILKPDGSQVAVVPHEGVSFMEADIPGVYTFLGSEQVRFAVNIAPAESKTAAMQSEELERLGVQLDVPTDAFVRSQRAERQRQLLAVEMEGRQKLWRWLLVATFGVLLLETWLAGYLTAPASEKDVAHGTSRS